MLITDNDHPLIRWAVQKAYIFDYGRPNGLPDPCLRIQLGLSTAYFHNGKLVRWFGESSGDQLDQLMYELSSLFAMCTGLRAYMSQRVAISPPEEIGFRLV